ncbi:MAG: hypothetical protein M3R24_39885 [Chloroflexota bacterium]|nr:hypothetical protein [Chloroflexota bacterium]
MGLEHGGAGAHNLTPLAAEVARGTDLGQTTPWLGKLGNGDQRTLARSLPGRVNIEDEQAVARMVNEPAQELSRHTMRTEVMGKLLAQALQARRVDVHEEAAEGGAVGQLVAPEERHEGAGERLQTVKEGLEGRLTAERIAKQDGDKIDDVVVTSAPAGEAHVLVEGVKHTALREMAGQED